MCVVSISLVSGGSNKCVLSVFAETNFVLLDVSSYSKC